MVAAAVGSILFAYQGNSFPPPPFVDWGRGEDVQNVLETQHAES
jgi:hypothetical protein